MSRIEFQIPADPRAVRQIRDDVVALLDRSLEHALPGGQFHHAFDPKRILTFAFGGPPVWSVGVASDGRGTHQFLTYGLSRVVDPAQPFSFELALRVRAAEVPLWPTMLLRSIARYMMTSGREIAPGEHMDMNEPISRAPFRAEEQASVPTTRMTNILVTSGITMPTPHGPLEIRNVFGLDPRERELLECCRSARFVEELRRMDGSLAVTLDSPSLADHVHFRAAIEAASAREGSDTRATCVPGFRWTDDGRTFSVHIPKASAASLRRRLASRLPFGEGLLVHGAAPGPGTEMLVLPASTLAVPEADAVRLVLELPFESPYVQLLRDDDAVWTFRYA